jgi:non-canonical (house-cleaning) NTP pyrophosphatase
MPESDLPCLPVHGADSWCLVPATAEWYRLCRRDDSKKNSSHQQALITLKQTDTPLPPGTIALGSDRAAKIMAVRASIARVATIEPAWAAAKLVARPVTTNAPAMPLTDWDLMQGARARAIAVCELLQKQKLEADLYVGLEGGFHSISVNGEWHTFLRGWAYVTDGASGGERGYFGATPSISVPESIRQKVIEGRRELALVIDEVSGARDVRSRQGAWGILSRDLVTRSLSFEIALVAAFAPFYNSALYT